MSHYVTIPETRKRTSSVVRHKLVERNMRLQVLLLLCALGVALAQSGCEMNPESCSPDDNHFHRSIKYGYCIANKVSENWTNRLTASPTSSHAGVLFGGNTLIVQGGSGAAGTLLSTQAINIDDFSVTNLPNLDARSGHSAIRWGNRMIIYGGSDSANNIKNDMWSLTLASSPESYILKPAVAWVNMPTPASAKAVKFHSANLWGTQMIIYGGKSSTFSNGDLISYDLNTNLFTTLSVQADGPMSKPRYSHAAAIADNTLYVFGGQWDAVQFNDMWAFDLKANKWRVLLQTSPYTLRSHSMVFMPACQSLVIFGGQTDQNKANSAVLAYHVDYDTMQISTASSGAIQYARSGHIAVASGSRMYVHGGVNLNGTIVGDLLEWM